MPQTPTKQSQWVTTGTGGSARHARDMKRPRRLVARGPEEPSRKRRCQADRPIKDDLSGVASRRPIDSFKTAKQQEPYRWIRQFTGEVAAKKMLGSLPRGGMEMRICLSALVVLGGCSAATPKVVTQTPASVSYEDVADAAQLHCRKAGKDARQTSLAIAPSGDLWTSFSCV